MSVPDQQPWAGVPAVDGGRPGHPTAVALAGFYVGMLLVVAVPSVYVGLVGSISSPQDLGTYAPLGLLVFAIPLVLIVVPRTRRFGRYLLLGMVSTVLVIGVVGSLVLWFLISR